jgi:Kef-type K+ transport system membrane component KefB
MSVIMLTTLIGGWLAPKVGQSRVVGEIVGGILRGLSVFGRIAPNISNSLFPKSSFHAFETLSTIGLILFLFLIGMELDHELFYRQRKKGAAGKRHELPEAVYPGARCLRIRCGYVSPLKRPAVFRSCCSSASR